MHLSSSKRQIKGLCIWSPRKIPVDMKMYAAQYVKLEKFANVNMKKIDPGSQDLATENSKFRPYCHSPPFSVEFKFDLILT